MDALAYRRYRRSGGHAAPAAWEFHVDSDGFDDAPAPAKVAKQLADYLGIELPAGSAAAANNAVHWATGLGWGLVAGVLHAAPRVHAVEAGAIVGMAAFATSYLVLPRLGIYQPIKEYDGETLARDLSAHLLYGTTVGIALLGVHRNR
jgi:hypothetical protein